MSDEFSTESDLAYQRRVITRCYRLAQRTDLDAEERLRQILEACAKALEKPAGDPEVIAQLKSLVAEYKDKALDSVIRERELGLCRAELAASESARRELTGQLELLGTSDRLGYRRLLELGCVLLDNSESDDAVAKGTRALVAAAKRLARELPDDERTQLGDMALLELLEGG